MPWEASVPDTAYGASPTALLHYARRSGETGESPAYVLQRTTAPVGADFDRVAEQGGVALYVTDPVVHQQHLAIRPTAPIGSPFLRVPRSTLYRGAASSDAYRIYDVVRISRRLTGGSDR